MSLNKKKQQDETSDQQKTHSKTNYEDCFVYDESRFTGIDFLVSMSPNLHFELFFKICIKIKTTSEPTFVVNKTILIIGL